MHKNWTFSLVLVAIISSCQTAPETDSARVRATLDRLLALHGQHTIHEDIDAIMAGYTQDAVVRSNHVEPLRGHTAIRNFITQMLDAVTIRTLTYETEDLAVYGDSAWQIGNYKVTLATPGQVEQSDHGSFMALWVRDPSKTWRIHRDILNSSVPLPPPSGR